MSGLNQRFTKPSNLNRFREFESHRLRFEFREKQRRASKLLYLCVRFERLFRTSETRWKSTCLCNGRKMYSWSYRLRYK